MNRFNKYKKRQKEKKELLRSLNAMVKFIEKDLMKQMVSKINSDIYKRMGIEPH
jgi:hypothetical protein